MSNAQEEKYQTGMASEFYILSLLFRAGAKAYLTLGNNKKVDIIVLKGKETLTIDVKGTHSTSFPVGKNYKDYQNDKNHFFIFVDYENEEKFRNTTTIPEIFIVPAQKMSGMVKNYSGERFNVLKKDLKTFTNDFSIFVEES